MGLTSLSGAVGLIAGVVIGSAVAEKASWRMYVVLKLDSNVKTLTSNSIFWINLPVCIPAGLGLAVFLNLRRPQTSLKEKIIAIDWFGMIIFTCSLVSFTYGVTAGGSLSPWSSAEVITPLVIGVCGIAIFLVYEGKWARQPMVPLRIFRNRTAISGYVSSWLHALVMWSVGYYLILYVSSSCLYSILLRRPKLNRYTVPHRSPILTYHLLRIFSARPRRHSPNCRNCRLYYVPNFPLQVCQYTWLDINDCWDGIALHFEDILPTSCSVRLPNTLRYWRRHSFSRTSVRRSSVARGQ